MTATTSAANDRPADVKILDTGAGFMVLFLLLLLVGNTNDANTKKRPAWYSRAGLSSCKKGLQDPLLKARFLYLCHLKPETITTRQGGRGNCSHANASKKPRCSSCSASCDKRWFFVDST